MDTQDVWKVDIKEDYELIDLTHWKARSRGGICDAINKAEFEEDDQSATELTVAELDGCCKMG